MILLKVKRWHWALIAMVAGAAFAFNHIHNEIPIGIRSVTPSEFMRQVRQQPWSNEATFVDDVTVHPISIGADGNKSQLITMICWTFDKRSNQWVQVVGAFEAAVPFMREPGSFDGGTMGDGTVLAFLEHAGGQRSGISYRYAWWELPALMYGIAMAASLLLIAGILPTVIQIAAAAGASSADQPTPPAPAATVFRHVDEPVVTKPVESEGAQTVTQLSTEPLPAETAAHDEKPKQYSGEFYPVSRTGQDSHGDTR